MKTATTQLLSFSIVALLLSGCYTQLEVVERPAHYTDRFERPAPNRSNATQDQYYIDEHGYAVEGYDEDSYVAGYEDAFADMDLQFRDFSRQPVFGNSSQYALGYRDGYRDASWSYNRHRFHSRYSSWHWDPFYSSGWHSSYYVSWGWHRPHSFWYGSPYHYYGYYSYPVHYHGFHHSYGWGYHRNTWVVYNYNTVNNINVNNGPRNSGIQRDRHNTGRNVAGVGNRTDTRANTSTTRSSGVSRDNTAVQRGTATDNGRSRGTVNRSPSTEGRSSGTTRPGVRRDGNSGASSGTVQRGNSSGRSSGTVRSGGDRSGGSSSSGDTSRRPRGNEMQSSNQLPVVSPGNTNSRERIVQDRSATQQPPATTTRTRANMTTNDGATRTNGQNTRVTRSDDNNRPTAVTRNGTAQVQRQNASAVTRTETTAPNRVTNTSQQRNEPAARPAPTPQRSQPAAQPAPRQQNAPSARPAPAPRSTPAARPAPAPQQSQPTASPQRSTSGNDARSTNRNRNRD